MTISNALPVQFWLNGVQSYNNKEVCGVEPICWCQPFQCDEEINIQFTDDVTIPAAQEETITMPDTPALTDFLTSTIDSNPDWTTGATPSVNIPGLLLGQDSEYLYVDYAFVEGYEYSLTFTYTRADNEAPDNPHTSTIVIMDSFFNELFDESDLTDSVGAGNTITITFTATSSCTRFGFRYTSGSDTDITITAFSGTRTGLEIIPDPGPDAYQLQVLDSNDNEIALLDFDALSLGNYTYLYSYSFIPNDHDICDQQIKLVIYLASSSPSEVASSDCLSIKTTHTCTLTMEYTNSKNFAGLIYEDVSPVPTFLVRIPAIFFEEDNPHEQEDIELSNGEIVRLYNKLEKRKKLDIGFLPHYMHEKVQLILMHDTVTIEERTWLRREAYEKVEGNKRYPLKRASVFLHDKNFIKENQL